MSALSLDDYGLLPFCLGISQSIATWIAGDGYTAPPQNSHSSWFAFFWWSWGLAPGLECHCTPLPVLWLAFWIEGSPRLSGCWCRILFIIILVLLSLLSCLYSFSFVTTVFTLFWPLSLYIQLSSELDLLLSPQSFPSSSQSPPLDSPSETI